MYFREAKNNPVIDKEIALVDNWGWKGRPKTKSASTAEQKEKWAQKEIREAVSLFEDLRFQMSWHTIEYVVPRKRSNNNPVPEVSTYDNARRCKQGDVPFWVGYGRKNECHIVDRVFLDNCTDSNDKLFFSEKFLDKVEKNPNKKYKILFNTLKKLKNNMKETHDDIQIHLIYRVIVEVTNSKGTKSNVVAFNGRQANGNVVKGITRQWLYTNFYEKENKFYRQLIYGNSEKEFPVPVGKSRTSSASATEIQLPTKGPTLKYTQGTENSCIVCSLASALMEFGDKYASSYVYRRLVTVREIQTSNRMVYVYDLMSGHHRMKGERALKYEAKRWKCDKYNILEQYTEVPVLCRIQDTLGATDHCVTVLRNWIFDSNYSHALPRTLKWLNFICARDTNTDEEDIAQFHCVYEAISVSPSINK
jgi:hypothetical protein